MRCEYRNCRNEARKVILNTKLCERHFEIVKKELLPFAKNKVLNDKYVDYKDVLEVLKTFDGNHITTKEICVALGVDYSRVANIINKFIKEGKLSRLAVGVYEINRKRL